MNPYLISFGVGTAVGFWYEKDLDRAATRSGIITGISAGLQTPTGKRTAVSVGTAGAVFAKDIVLTTYYTAGFALSTATAGVVRTGITYGLAVGAGAVIGAAAGTAISSVAFGQAGKQKAIDFYTGQNTSLIDYIPHYNAYKIVRHYAKEAIE